MPIITEEKANLQILRDIYSIRIDQESQEKILYIPLF